MLLGTEPILKIRTLLMTGQEKERRIRRETRNAREVETAQGQWLSYCQLSEQIHLYDKQWVLRAWTTEIWKTRVLINETLHIYIFRVYLTCNFLKF